MSLQWAVTFLLQFWFGQTAGKDWHMGAPFLICICLDLFISLLKTKWLSLLFITMFCGGDWRSFLCPLPGQAAGSGVGKVRALYAAEHHHVWRPAPQLPNEPPEWFKDPPLPPGPPQPLYWQGTAAPVPLPWGHCQCGGYLRPQPQQVGALPQGRLQLTLPLPAGFGAAFACYPGLTRTHMHSSLWWGVWWRGCGHCHYYCWCFNNCTSGISDKITPEHCPFFLMCIMTGHQGQPLSSQFIVVSPNVQSEGIRASKFIAIFGYSNSLNNFLELLSGEGSHHWLTLDDVQCLHQPGDPEHVCGSRALGRAGGQDWLMVPCSLCCRRQCSAAGAREAGWWPLEVWL